MDLSKKIRILLADDHELVRAGLRALLEGEPRVEVVAEAGDGRTAVALAAELSPDVVVMDINMPSLNGIEATRQITARGAGEKMVVLSGHRDLKVVYEMLRAGASAYVLKASAFEELALALRAFAANRTYVSPAGGGEGSYAGVMGRQFRPHPLYSAPGSGRSCDCWPWGRPPRRRCTCASA